MVRPPKPKAGEEKPKGPEEPPRTFAEVAPPAYAQAVGATYMVETVMQMQQSIGELKANVAHLAAASKSQSDKLDKISHRIYAAGVVIVIIMGVVGFILNKMWDGIVQLLKMAH